MSLRQSLPIILGLSSAIAFGIGVFIALWNGGFLAGCFGLALLFSIASIILDTEYFAQLLNTKEKGQ